MAQVAGRFTIVVNGTPLETMPGASLELGGINKTPVNTDQLSTHSKEEYRNALVKGSLVLTPGAPVETLRNLTLATLTFQADNGTKYTVTNVEANESGGWEYKTESIDVEFFGNAAKES